MVNCNICGGATTIIEVKEQMLGLNETFAYNRCVECGHTHLNALPEDMQKYYARQQYYSFKNDGTFLIVALNNCLFFLKKTLIKLNIKKSFLFSSALYPILSIKGINKDSTILDYGCGAGHFVKELNALGFSKARGFDLYLEDDISKNGEILLTSNLGALASANWNVITLNHVFEHLEHPVEVLKALRNLLSEKGKMILRFPVIDSFAFEKYKENWVQFDAPRHINLFTRKSIDLVIEKTGGYKIIGKYDDSFHFQFTGSELYLKKKSLSPAHNSRIKRLLSLKTYQFHFLAKRLNKQNKGDQMVIILERT
jgi:2-polyprenyl-3-methyl-5-hydroxy-6-metoxy-1,4-benzoquinol methylase